ncbi:YicC/YloC family endoribonuclease [Poseidonocella pacifica]|nr:YicC/YloC family endoribonuclease [Poseidonocella pacifica]
MTGFAARTGSGAGFSWSWEIRTVNARGLDLRLRVPDWIPALEPKLREAISARLTRGNVSLALRVMRTDAGTRRLSPAGLEAALDALQEISTVAAERGLSLADPRAAEILQMRGVVDDSGAAEGDLDALRTALLDEVTPLLDALEEMRQIEGASLAPVLKARVTQIAALTDSARALLPERTRHMEANLRGALDRIRPGLGDVAEDRVAQELAMMSVKADVAEELDRLDAHVDAAQTLLASGAPVGRKLDFLTQEFNREANTLCSKAQFAPLTTLGLELKTVIDQLREQVQNVE